MIESNANTLIIHSLPALGGAGLSVILPALGTRACALPSVWLTATADFPNSKRWAEETLIEKLEAQVQLLESQNQAPELFIGYLANVEQAHQLKVWLDGNHERLARVWIDPICGDNGKAYVAQELLIAWSALLNFADVLLPNTTEISLLSQVAGISREDWIASHTQHAQVIETSAKGENGTNGIYIHNSESSRFIEVVWEPGRYRGTGDLFASYLIAAVAKGWAWDAAVKQAAELVRKTIRKTREAGSESLILP